MQSKNRRVAVLGGVRTPFARIGGPLAKMTVIDLLGAALQGTVDRFNLSGQRLGDVCLGTVFFPPSQWNMAREAVLRSSLAKETPAVGLQRACATGLDAVDLIAQKISAGRIEVGIAGGVDSASQTAIFFGPEASQRFVQFSQSKTWGQKFQALKGLKMRDLSPRAPAAVELQTGMSMGEHCELMAKEWKISREEQDELAFESHARGSAAYQKGFYKDMVMKVGDLERDATLRMKPDLASMAKLKPVFDREAGTLTAANSTPLSDGAACVLLASEEWAKEHGHTPLAYFRDCESAAIDLKKEGLLMAPAYAVPRLIARNQMKLQDFDLYEIHEAFAAQVLCTLKAWTDPKFCKERLGLEAALGKIDRSKLNTHGGSLALAHPFAATGARIVATLAEALDERGGGKGLISICTGGGMGTTAILER